MRAKKPGIILLTTLLLSFAFINLTVYAEDISPFKSIKKEFKQAKNSKLNKNSKTTLKAKVDKTPKIKDRQIIVKFKDPSKATLNNFKLTSIKTSSSMKKKGMLVARIPDNADFDKAIEELNKNNAIEYVEPNYGYKLSAIPNDPSYSTQWHLPKISLPATWNTYKGSSSIKVAVIDTGIDTTHPDLQGRLVQGYDFINNDNIPEDECQGSYVYGHGTMASGVIGAATNNGVGVSGVDWNCKIMPLKVAERSDFFDYDEDGEIDEDEYDCYLYDDAIVNAIDYAVANGADVINMSFGGGYPSIAMYNALYEAYQQNVVLVAAAGNESWSLCYPAAFPFVISVGATDETDTLADFSNYGEGLDICAPGTDMYSTKPITAYDGDGHWDGVTAPTHGYIAWDGTSFSSPTVAGVAALLLSKNSNLTPKEVAWILESSADMPSAYGTDRWDYELGYGRVNALSALNKAAPFFPNDTSCRINSAKQIQLNQTYTDKFELPMDTDLFKFQVGTGYTSANIDLGAPSAFDMYAELYRYDPATGTLDYDNVQTIDSSYLAGDENAVVSVTPGTYYLAVSDYYGQWSTDSYTVTVSTKILNSIKATPASLTLCEDSIEPVTITAYYSDGSSEDINASSISSESSNSSIAEVEGNYISGVSAGKATITFSFGGKTAKVSATVKPELTDITFERNSFDVEAGKTLTIKAIAHYIDGTSEDVTKYAEWGSSDESIATVANGKITALNIGGTDIVVTFAGETVTVEVDVIPVLTALTAENSTINIQQGDVSFPEVLATYIDNSTSYVSSRCIWKATGSVIEVSSSGTVTALSKGKAKLTATYGSKKVTITVNVTGILESVSIKEPQVDVTVGSTRKLKVYAKYVGDDKLYEITKDVSLWFSDDDTIVSVANGIITGVAKGETDVYAEYQGSYDYVTVSVINSITNLSIQVENKTMVKGSSQKVTVLARLSSGAYEDVTKDCDLSISNYYFLEFNYDFDEEGNIGINALDRGKAKITARYGSKRAILNIRIIQAELQN